MPHRRLAAHRHLRHRRRLAVRRRPRALLGSRQPRLQRHARDHRVRRVGVRLPGRRAGDRRHDRRCAGARRRRHLGRAATAPIRSATRAPRSSASSPRARRGPTPGCAIARAERRRRHRQRRRRHRRRRAQVPRLLPRARPEGHAVRDSGVDRRDAVERDLDLAAAARRQPRAVVRLHELDRRDRLRRGAAARRRGRRRAVGRRRRVRDARHDLRLLADEGAVDGVQRSAGAKRRGRSTRGRDGFVLGEGAWMVVLEREDRARARGATIYASIDGYGSTCDAYHRVQMAPDGEEIVRAMTLAIERSGRRPEEIGYVNYHGTSTVLNDAVESRCVRQVFGAHADRLAGIVGQVDDRPPAGRQRRRRRRDRGARAVARVPAADDQPRTTPIPPAISTSSRTRDARPASRPRSATAWASDRRTARWSSDARESESVIERLTPINPDYRSDCPMLDVLIVGAGPAGAVAGAILARAGARVRIVDRATFPRDKLCGDTVNPGTLARLQALDLARGIDERGLRVDGMSVTGERGVTIEGRYPGGLSGRAIDAARPRLAAAAAGDRRRLSVRAGRRGPPRDRRRAGPAHDRCSGAIVGSGRRESPIDGARDDRRRRPSFDDRVRPRPRAPSRRVRGAGPSAPTSRISYRRWSDRVRPSDPRLGRDARAPRALHRRRAGARRR